VAGTIQRSAEEVELMEFVFEPEEDESGEKP
jgi:hypothetical protein